jgi:2-dehydro-3-deoxy-D-gluconate 5-dehydrogenase
MTTSTSPFDLTGKVVLVTGGGRGLGLGMAKGVSDAGATVVLASRNAEQLDAAVADIAGRGGRAVGVPTDLSSPQAARHLVDAVVDDHGRIDGMIHAAGNQHRAPVLDFPIERFDDVVSLHLRTAFDLAQATARRLVAQGEGGSIVLVGSLTSEAAGIRNVVAYGAAKSGLLGVMRGFAVELADQGIRVNTIAPGFFATEMTADVKGDPYRESLYARIPAQRMGTPDDLAGAATFFLSDASRYVTGQCLTVDGGWEIA